MAYSSSSSTTTVCLHFLSFIFYMFYGLKLTLVYLNPTVSSHCCVVYMYSFLDTVIQKSHWTQPL